MTLPSNEDFDKFLSATSIVRHVETSATFAHARITGGLAKDEEGSVSADRSFWLRYPETGRLKFDSLLRRVSHELRNRGHKDDREFSLTAVALSCVRKNANSSSIDSLNAVLNAVCDADVSCFLILPIEIPSDYDFDIPPFHIGRLRTERLKSRCERAGADYYIRYRDRLMGSWAIEREHTKCRVFDIPILISEVRLGNSLTHESIVNSLVMTYFGQLNEVLFKTFISDFIVSQDLLLSLGAPYFDPVQITSLHGSDKVAVFLNIGSSGGGYVAPTKTSGPSLITLAGAHLHIPAVLNDLEQHYQFDGTDPDSLTASIKLYSTFSGRARRYQISGNLSEAFVTYIIGLELIFGERTRIQSSFAERIAVLSFAAGEKKYQDERSNLERLYNARSSFVHAGKVTFTEADVSELHSYSKTCLKALLSLQKAKKQNLKVTHLDDWLSELDFFAKGLEIGRITQVEGLFS